MVLTMKSICPKCGGKDISNVTSSPLSRGISKRYGKQWPEPDNDEPDDHYIPPAWMDFNHTQYCNSCGHYFGGSFGG